MQQHRLNNGSIPARKQQTAVKHTVDRPKVKSWLYNSTHQYRTHPYPNSLSSSSSSTIHQIASITSDDHSWSKSSTRILDETPDLELFCQEEALSEAQMKHYPTQAYDPSAPLPLPSVRKRTTVMKKLSNNETDIFQDADEDFIPSESEEDDDDDDDENYLPEHDRRPYHRSSHINGNVGRGRGRGARHHVSVNSNRLAPSTYFVRPQPARNSNSRSEVQPSSSFNSHRHRISDSQLIELERTYTSSLLRFYGTANGQAISSSEYGDYRIKCSVCAEQSSNNMSFIAHLCSHFEDDLNYISPFDKIYRRCSVCQDEFSSPFQTFLHKDQAHMLELQEFRCRICHQQHSSLSDLFSHLNSTHAGLDMPYHCDRCNYRTSMYEDMAYHIRQMHRGTQYFFCPYCFQSVLLPNISYTNVLNSTPAFRHVIHHFDRIENGPHKQQRRIESLFEYCTRCTLHVKSLAEHYQVHHPLTFNANGQTNHNNEDEHDSMESKRNYSRSINEQRYQYQTYPPKFDRTKSLPMATIRRRPPMSAHDEQISSSSRWYGRR